MKKEEICCFAGHRNIVNTDQEIVRSSGHMICCVENEWGGAYKTMKYAEKLGNIKIYNIL